MGDREDAELERLRRAAFARGGTAEDLEALAEALAVPAPVVESTPAEPAEERAPADDEPTASIAPSGTRRAWTVRAAALGIVALVAGAAGGWMLRDATAGPAQSPTLAAFAWLPEADNPWPDSLEHADSRLLGEFEGVRLIGTTGSTPDYFPGSAGPQVCLWVEDPNISSGACAPRDHFLRSGVFVSVTIREQQRTYYWGPDGPPAILACDPQRWLESCPAGIATPTVPTLAP